MPFTHLLLILLVILIWGINFLFVKLGLNEISPLLLCAIRFFLASVPAIFFIKPPRASFLTIFSYGFIMFALQFSLLFIGIHLGMTAGMASIIMQIQVFFSIFFAAAWLKEIPLTWQIAGALVSFLGIGLIAFHTNNAMPFTGLLFIIGAAATWGIGNLIIKKTHKEDMFALLIWGSFFAFIPMLCISLSLEGIANVSYTYHHLTWIGIVSILYIVYASTWVGYGIWNWLVGRYPIATIVPFTLLTPIVAILSSTLILNEPLESWKLVAASFVIAGLIINIVGSRLHAKTL